MNRRPPSISRRFRRLRMGASSIAGRAYRTGRLHTKTPGSQGRPRWYATPVLRFRSATIRTLARDERPTHPHPHPHPIPRLALAQRAARLFADGNAEEARTLFAQALTPDTTDIQILFLVYQFHFRSGELEEAEQLVRRRLAVTGPDTDSADTARAYTNLGLVRLYRKDIDGAQREFTRAVDISKRIGDQYGLARAVGNLGLAPEARGELDRAEELFRESLAIARRIGADDIASTKLANLGDIAVLRGRPDQARELWTQAIELFARLGNRKHHAEFSQKLAELDKPSAA